MKRKKFIDFVPRSNLIAWVVIEKHILSYVVFHVWHSHEYRKQKQITDYVIINRMKHIMNNWHNVCVCVAKNKFKKNIYLTSFILCVIKSEWYCNNDKSITVDNVAMGFICSQICSEIILMKLFSLHLNFLFPIKFYCTGTYNNKFKNSICTLIEK